jgi:hypothetical protein
LVLNLTYKPAYTWQEDEKQMGAVCDWFNLHHPRQGISGTFICNTWKYNCSRNIFTWCQSL